MKTLKHHTIIYDQECPMCHLYTGAFVKTGMLDTKGRMSFGELKEGAIPMLDRDRAKTEIALINRKDQSVQYGVDSLTTIIGHRFPIFNPLFRTWLFQFLIRHFYLFISYNRKEIAPGSSFESHGSCTPRFHYGYRWAYLIVTCLATSMILYQYAHLFYPWLPAAHWGREILICGGQLMFQGWVVAMIKRDRWMHYLGNAMTISMSAALLLLPMLWISSWVAPWVVWGYFFLVVSLMLLKHIRRVKLLELPWIVTGTWVLYRVLILVVLL